MIALSALALTLTTVLSGPAAPPKTASALFDTTRIHSVTLGFTQEHRSVTKP